MILTIGTTPALARTMVFPRVEIGDVNRAKEVHVSGAGKAINAARVLHTLGEQVACAGFVGGDSGRAICDELDSLRIAHRFVDAGKPTRVCVTVIDRSAGNTTELIEESAPISTEGWAMLHADLADLIPATEVVLLSGSIAPGGPVSHYAVCCEIARQVNIPVVIDGKGPALLAALEHKPAIVKPNAGELLETLGATASDEAAVVSAMNEIVRLGAGWVVVTRGGEGVLATDGKQILRIAIPKVKVVSPIGSGDSFAAGLTAGLRRGQSVKNACVLAAACGSANAMTDQAGHLDASVVERLMREVRITAIAAD